MREHTGTVVGASQDSGYSLASGAGTSMLDSGRDSDDLRSDRLLLRPFDRSSDRRASWGLVWFALLLHFSERATTASARWTEAVILKTGRFIRHLPAIFWAIAFVVVPTILHFFHVGIPDEIAWPVGIISPAVAAIWRFRR